MPLQREKGSFYKRLNPSARNLVIRSAASNGTGHLAEAIALDGSLSWRK